MKSSAMWWCAFAVLLLAGGCSDDDAKQADLDGGADPDSVRPDVAVDGEQPRLDQAAALDLDSSADVVPDVALGDNYGLEIASGLQACSTDRFASDQLALVRTRKGRLTLRSGMHVLLKDSSEQFALDLIESLELGPSRTKIVPGGPGQVEQGETYGGAPTFVFTQQLDVDGSSAEVRLSVVFEPDAASVAVLDVESLSNRLASLSVTHDNWTVMYGPCDYTFYSCTSRRFELSGDDVLETESCGLCPGGMICKSNLGGMARARFSRAGNVVEDLSDHFNLAHSYRHHNWGEDSLVIFDNPVGTTHGVYVGTEQYPDHFVYKTASYLDANMQVVETREVLDVKAATW